jgi:hypothetical protein
MKYECKLNGNTADFDTWLRRYFQNLTNVALVAHAYGNKNWFYNLHYKNPTGLLFGRIDVQALAGTNFKVVMNQVLFNKDLPNIFDNLFPALRKDWGLEYSGTFAPDEIEDWSLHTNMWTDFIEPKKTIKDKDLIPPPPELKEPGLTEDEKRAFAAREFQEAYARDNPGEKATIEMAALHLGVSKSSLEKAFRKTFGPKQKP